MHDGKHRHRGCRESLSLLYALLFVLVFYGIARQMAAREWWYIKV